MPEYEFFVSSGAPKPATRAMRSHAMRTALQIRSHKGEATEEGHAGSTDSQRTRDHKRELQGRFRLTSKPVNRKSGHQDQLLIATPAHRSPETAASSLRHGRSVVLVNSRESTGGVQWFGSGYVDPFGTLPVPNNSRVDVLVKYCLTRFNLNIRTVDKERPWFGYAMVEPAIMHATLALVAAFWTAGSDSVDSGVLNEGLYQKGQAIRIVNEYLRRGEVADTVVAAVSTLANVAANAGDFQEADVHVKAARRLVDLRGGAHVVKDNFFVARALNWVDIQIAAGIGRKPLLPLIHEPEDIDLPQHLAREADTPSLGLLDGIGFGSKTIKSVFMCVRQAILCRDHSIAAPNGIRIILNIADHEILAHLEDTVSTPSEHRFITLLVATHVFMYTAMRQLPKKGPLVSILLGRLQAALDGGEINSLAWQHHTTALLWALFVGAISTEGHAGGMGEWFSSRLRVVCHVLRVQSRGAMKERLRMFLWSDEYCSKFLNTWWDEGRGMWNNS